MNIDKLSFDKSKPLTGDAANQMVRATHEDMVGLRGRIIRQETRTTTPVYDLGIYAPGQATANLADQSLVRYERDGSVYIGIIENGRIRRLSQIQYEDEL